MDALKGQLLVATPALVDANFARTVVLVAEHSEEGAMGLVLNRPAELVASEAVPEIRELLEPDEPLHVGGPVQSSAIVVLAEFEDAGEAAVLVFDDVGFIPAEADPLLLTGSTRRARAFAGFAGWGEGQLESEIEEGSWILEPARLEDVFTDDPDGLWSTVLRRKGGQYALLALMPLDPSLN